MSRSRGLAALLQQQLRTLRQGNKFVLSQDRAAATVVQRKSSNFRVSFSTRFLGILGSFTGSWRPSLTMEIVTNFLFGEIGFCIDLVNDSLSSFFSLSQIRNFSVLATSFGHPILELSEINQTSSKRAIEGVQDFSHGWGCWGMATNSFSRERDRAAATAARRRVRIRRSVSLIFSIWFLMKKCLISFCYDHTSLFNIGGAGVALEKTNLILINSFFSFWVKSWYQL